MYPAAAITVGISEGIVVRTDPKFLESVIENIVENAIEHTSTDTPEITIRAERTTSERVQLEVIDNGPGIPEQDGGRYSKATNPLAHGSGLGL